MTASEPSLFIKQEPRYDLRNDQTLPGLQTATNQATTYRYRALYLRQIYLAGLAHILRCPNRPPKDKGDSERT